MRGLICRAAVVAGAAVVLLGPAVGVASAARTALTGTHLAAGALAGSGGTWGTAEEVPGTAALNQDGDANVTSVSCASAGTCSAGGWYEDSSGDYEAFVVSEVHGTWGTAEEVPGTAALNQGIAAFAEVASVSCAAAGTCAAGGNYVAKSGDYEAFVVSEVHSKWRKAEEVPGTAALNQGGSAAVSSVSCAAPGTCTAGGGYTDSSGDYQVFVVSEVHGTWGTAEEVPGIAALNQGGYAAVSSVSCAAAGTCSVGGYYTDSSSDLQAFVVSEVHSKWRKAEEVPGTAALNKYGDANASSVSCAAGTCTAGGYYDGSGGQQAFVASEADGTWGKAEQVPGLAALGRGAINSLSCAAAGTCTAGGGYDVGSSTIVQSFVASEADGTWGKAKEVPGLAALNQGGVAIIFSVSCAAAGTCGAGGIYVDSSDHYQVFVVSEADGTWGKAEEVPGTAALNQGGGANLASVSCATAGTCVAGGYYNDSSRLRQAFVTTG